MQSLLAPLQLRGHRGNLKEAPSAWDAVVRKKHILNSLCCLALGSLLALPAAQAQKRAIDVQHSVLKVRVFKTGFFSALGHEHEILAPIASGDVDDSAPASIVFRVDTAKLKVLDPGASAADRAKVQTAMETQVLDVAHFPEIRFQSLKVESTGAGRWDVQGDLMLHGQTRPIVVHVVQFQCEYRGAAAVKQSDFGITPITVGGGAVKVKDEVKVEFQIALAR